MLRLLRLQSRRDRVILPVWIVGIVLLVFASTSAVGSEYGDESEREGILTLALDPRPPRAPRHLRTARASAAPSGSRPSRSSGSRSGS